MQLSFGEHNIELSHWETKEQMIKALEVISDTDCLILGQETEQKTQFYSITAELGWNGLRQFGIGICSEGHGLKPRLLLKPQTNELVLGFNREVVAINISEQKIDFHKVLDSLFRSFLHLAKQRTLLVFHEMGVVALDEVGRTLWQVEEDIIEDCKIEEETVSLKFMDASPINIALSNGATSELYPPLNVAVAA